MAYIHESDQGPSQQDANPLQDAQSKLTEAQTPESTRLFQQLTEIQAVLDTKLFTLLNEARAWQTTHIQTEITEADERAFFAKMGGWSYRNLSYGYIHTSNDGEEHTLFLYHNKEGIFSPGLAVSLYRGIVQPGDALDAFKERFQGHIGFVGRPLSISDLKSQYRYIRAEIDTKDFKPACLSDFNLPENLSEQQGMAAHTNYYGYDWFGKFTVQIPDDPRRCLDPLEFGRRVLDMLSTAQPASYYLRGRVGSITDLPKAYLPK